MLSHRQERSDLPRKWIATQIFAKSRLEFRRTSGVTFRGMTGSAWFDREFKMTVQAPRLLTPDEFASLIEIAITSPTPTVPPPHLTKLINLGYVIATPKGPVVTGDGLIRITESE